MDWGLFESPDFKEWMRMLRSCLTSLTKIEVFTNRTFVTNSFNVSPVAAVAGNAYVFRLLSDKVLLFWFFEVRLRFFDDNRFIFH